MDMRPSKPSPVCSPFCASNMEALSKALREANRQNTLLRSVLRAIAHMPQDAAKEIRAVARDTLANL